MGREVEPGPHVLRHEVDVLGVAGDVAAYERAEGQDGKPLLPRRVQGGGDQLAGKPLGFVNPAIYKLAQSAAYANDFHDITTGNNQMFGTTPSETAGIGYDLASGWGTPNVSNLLPDLVACVTTAVCP